MTKGKSKGSFVDHWWIPLIGLIFLLTQISPSTQIFDFYDTLKILIMVPLIMLGIMFAIDLYKHLKKPPYNTSNETK